MQSGPDDIILFPPSTRPGSVAESSYNPIVRLPDGSFINAPIIAKIGATTDDLMNPDDTILHDRYQNRSIGT